MSTMPHVSRTNFNGNGDVHGERELARRWSTDARWRGVTRPYTAQDVYRLRGTMHIEHTLANRGARRFWDLLTGRDGDPYIAALGAMTGNQALQQVQAGLKAVYVSGWQVAADANAAGQMYPDQSLYPSESVPALVRRINNAFIRADQIHHCDGDDGTYWFAPLVADAEAGFGGTLNAFEIMKAMIEAGAAAVHFEDQLSAEKKCGHLGGKVLVPTREAVKKLIAARLAADVLDVPTLLIARTDANAARLISSDSDPRDHAFLTGESTPDGFHEIRGGVEAAVARALAYAPYADMLWCETSHPDLDEAREFAEGIHDQFPGKMLAYNCSPSFNWRQKLDPQAILRFQRELGEMGYQFQFITLAGFHALNYSMFQMARDYRRNGMAAYADLQDNEFAAQEEGYAATTHQRFVGTGYFDEVAQVISCGENTTAALTGSTEEQQFGRANGVSNSVNGEQRR
jgi:isocitrate lyase